MGRGRGEKEADEEQEEVRCVSRFVCEGGGDRVRASSPSPGHVRKSGWISVIIVWFDTDASKLLMMIVMIMMAVVVVVVRVVK
jgi:hypothetical protein